MKVGSKVVYVGISGYSQNECDQRFIDAGYVIPSRKKIYTVRRIYTTTHGTYILLQEIFNPFHENIINEAGYIIDAFRELNQTPDLSETTYEDIMQEIEQTELTPQTA